ncbi:hypothetical protein [Mycolicibacterium smegmatis]|uniref:hypothetical protein n=1 Tax=Mycolicibacterium smegmatis TaxID=1772 RepID=UPI0013003953|nr:hypothetical protein [Mycolicibacterium smegmatis]
MTVDAQQSIGRAHRSGVHPDTHLARDRLRLRQTDHLQCLQPNAFSHTNSFRGSEQPESPAHCSSRTRAALTPIFDSQLKRQKNIGHPTVENGASQRKPCGGRPDLWHEQVGVTAS